jgi:beta-lactamase regulating signal transducer with metallopeptidase domain
MLNHLLDVSIQSLLMALVAASVLWLARRGRSAALQHAVWTAVVCGMLSLFVFGGYLPRMPLRIPARTVSLPATSIVASTDLPVPRQEFTSAPTRVEAPTPRSLDWNEVALAAYFVIALMFLIRFAFGIFLARRLIAGSHRSGSFYQSELISVPVTVGFFRPRIILPCEWREWDSEKLTAVLIHEGAHVRRRGRRARACESLHFLVPSSCVDSGAQVGLAGGTGVR